MFSRFRKQNFQEKLVRAREYERKTGPNRLLRFSIGILVLAVFYFLTISSTFLVERLVLSSKSINPEEVSEALKKIRSERVYFIPRNHILLLNQENFLKFMQKELPQIRAVKNFKRILPGTIQVEIEEREGRFIWQTGVNHYLADQDGTVFKKLLNYDPASFSQILIVNKLEEEVVLGQELPARPLVFFEEIKNLWSSQISQTNIASASLPAARSTDIFVKTGIGFEVYFDIERKADIQLKNLQLLLSGEIKPETYSGLSYIDLRLPSIAYYCYQDAPCALENQK